MRPHVQISYSSKFTSLGETEPMDVLGMLREDAHLPASKAFIHERLWTNTGKMLTRLSRIWQGC